MFFPGATIVTPVTIGLKGKTVITYVGRVSNEKNITVLVQAFAKLKEEAVVRASIVDFLRGRGEDEYLYRLAIRTAKRRRLPESESVQFVGAEDDFYLPVFKDKTVAVVGGGNSGFETALFLSNYVKKIYILEHGKEVKADKENQDLVFKTKKAELITNTKVLKIKGDTFVKQLLPRTSWDTEKQTDNKR